MQKILIFGATSSIAQSVAKIFAEKDASLFLVARSEEKLRQVAQDLDARGKGSVEFLVADPAKISDQKFLFPQIEARFPIYDTVIVAYGSLPNQQEAATHPEEFLDAVEVNFSSVATLLMPIVEKFERNAQTELPRRIVVIGSVAGDRGRQSNYVYGASKGALAIFLQGLRNRLAPRGIQVLTVKPGFVDTPMTADMKKGLLFASPDRVARHIVKAIERGRNELYTPWFWRPILLVIRSIPEILFKRLRL
jgi:decaprenylphospho-beta-D-erythro-pentofuranosid-2-ulose 2-reductase